MFNKYFTSAFVDNTNTKSILLTQDSTSNSVISDISLPVKEVQSILEALKPEKATGPDEILARFLKETAPMNAPSSTVLFNRSLREGNIPSDLPVISRVPQGSLLWPALFLIYMKSLPSAVRNSEVMMFEDDTNIYK